MKIKLALITLAVALAAGMAQAELIASLHVDANITDAVNVDVAGPLAARSTSGNANTIGTLAGSVNFLAASPGQLISDIYGYSASSQFRDLNRYGNNANGGSVVTWDFDFTGLSNPEYQFNVDFTAEGGKPVEQQLGFYISYSDGASLALDTTDIKTQTPGAGALVTANTAEYVSLLDLGPTSTGGQLSIDITTFVNTAIANGGGIRIAMVDNTYRNTVTFFNATGIESIPEPATLGLVGLFGAATLFVRRRLMM